MADPAHIDVQFLGTRSGQILRPPLSTSPWSFRGLVCKSLKAYNALRWAVGPPATVALPSVSKELHEVRELAERPNDINEHLELIFTESLLIWPRLIVELGVRGGTSTFVFERVADVCGASIVSVDIDDCSSTSFHRRRHFVQADDVQFAACFKEFCGERHINPSVDLLFIDTSHYYDHTVQEIEAWFPLLSPRAKVLFHDTNLRFIGPRRDGCFALAWNNNRGVVRAIEERFRIKIEEDREFTEYADGWLIRHWPTCNGFTVIDKLLP